MHGTFVAGLLTASGNASGIRGVAPNVKLMALRFLDDNNLFYGDDWLQLINAIEYAVDNGAEIINFSLEFLHLPSDPEIARSLNNTIDKAYKKGVVMVSVTGNAGQDSIAFPGKFSEVIAVSATDKENKVANFSNYGSETEICAPGVDIYSTIPGGSYQTISGTSFSAPLISGAIGLMISLKLGLSPFEIREILQLSSIDLGAKGKDPLYGYGLLNISAALVMTLNFSSSEKQSRTTLTNATTPLEVDNMTFFLIIALFIVQNMKKKH